MAILNDPKAHQDFLRMIEEERRIQMHGAHGTGMNSYHTGLAAGGVISAQALDPYHHTRTPDTMLHHVSVDKVENGFLMKVQHAPNAPVKQFIAATAEELQRVFIAAIVAERISK